MLERIYREPVHNIIRLRTDTDEGRLMVRLIDAPEFQRLRRLVRGVSGLSAIDPKGKFAPQAQNAVTKLKEMLKK